MAGKRKSRPWEVPGKKATFDPEKRQVVVDGDVWTGYKSTADSCFFGLF